MSAEQYITSLLNPFDSTFAQPKILDGSVPRSAGIRFRNVGTVTLDGTGADTYFILYPGFSYCLNWKTDTDYPVAPSINPSHVGTLADRVNVKKLRMVSCGLRLSLENTSDDNEGSWEAVRIPYNFDDWELIDQSSPTMEDLAVKIKSAFTITDMPNHSTFQTGRLKDIHRFLFKLNSVKPDHDFTNLNQSQTTLSGLSDATVSPLDASFDVVVIKVNGRVNATVPSVLRYDVVSNQEVVYKEGTALGRIMGPNVMFPNINVILDKTRFMLPAIQVA